MMLRMRSALVFPRLIPNPHPIVPTTYPMLWKVICNEGHSLHVVGNVLEYLAIITPTGKIVPHPIRINAPRTCQKLKKINLFCTEHSKNSQYKIKWRPVRWLFRMDETQRRDFWSYIFEVTMVPGATTMTLPWFEVCCPSTIGALNRSGMHWGHHVFNIGANLPCINSSPRLSESEAPIAGSGFGRDRILERKQHTKK